MSFFCYSPVKLFYKQKKLIGIAKKSSRTIALEEIAPNSNPNWGAIFLGGNCPDTVKKYRNVCSQVSLVNI